MKRFFVFMFFMLSITVTNAQITIEHKGTLKELLTTIHEKYGYRFMYSNSDINDMQKISINTKNSSIDNLLKEISAKTNIAYTIINKQIILKPQEKSAIKTPVKTEVIVKKEEKPREEQKKEEQQKQEETLPEKTLIEEATKEIDPIVEEKVITEPEKLTEIVVSEEKKDVEPKEVVKITEPKKENQFEKNKNSIHGFSIHTNLLYNLAFTPNLGLEYTIKGTFGIVINGAWGHVDWDDESQTYRLWALTPEVRYYVGQNKRLYAGAMFQIGELNVKFGEEGKQGNFIGGGINFGYILNLSDNFRMDLGLGYGYTNYKYETYNFVKGVNIKRSSENKNLWIPTKLGVTLIWKIK